MKHLSFLLAGFLIATQAIAQIPISVNRSLTNSNSIAGQSFTVEAEVSSNYEMEAYLYRDWNEMDSNWGYGYIFLSDTHSGSHGDVIEYSIEAYDYDWYDEAYLEFTHLVSSKPFMELESFSGTNDGDGVVSGTGWSADPLTGGLPATKLRIMIGNTVLTNGLSITSQSRSDVSLDYNRSGFLNSGWSFSLQLPSLSIGSHTLKVQSIDSTGRINSIERTLSITQSSQSGGGNNEGEDPVDPPIEPGDGNGNNQVQDPHWASLYSEVVHTGAGGTVPGFQIAINPYNSGSLRLIVKPNASEAFNVTLPSFLSQ